MSMVDLPVDQENAIRTSGFVKEIQVSGFYAVDEINYDIEIIGILH